MTDNIKYGLVMLIACVPVALLGFVAGHAASPAVAGSGIALLLLAVVIGLIGLGLIALGIMQKPTPGRQ